MTDQQQSAAIKYLGCMCEIYNKRQGYVWDTKPLDTIILSDHYFLSEHLFSFRLLVTPIADLTQDDLDQMYTELYPEVLNKQNLKHWHEVFDDLLPYKMADWLRKNGYLLDDELNKEFIRIKEQTKQSNS